MCYASSRESLYSFGIPEITKGLRRKGFTLHKIDLLFKPESWNYVEIPWVWTSTDRLTGEKKENKIKVFVRKDPGGMYLELQYSFLRRLSAGDVWYKMSLRYDLVRRESNLKPGTYRYYIKDPYSSSGSQGGICTRLYLLPDIGEFVPRSVLKSYGVLYSQQRKGHKERYLYPSWKTPDTRYRKSHYRGRITPFWARYEDLQEEEEIRFLSGLIVGGLSRGLVPPEIEEEILQEYRRKTGRKTTPDPFSIYRTSRHPSRRR